MPVIGMWGGGTESIVKVCLTEKLKDIEFQEMIQKVEEKKLAKKNFTTTEMEYFSIACHLE